MGGKKLLVVTDRGGHLHDALRLMGQMEICPNFLVTTEGPDVDYLKKNPELKAAEVFTVPQSFFWIGKKRVWSPFRFLKLFFKSLHIVLRTRPDIVISTGATNVVYTCLIAKLFGSTLVHVENLAQVKNASVTGRILYPFADHFFVQWKDLLDQYGPKAQFAGWVI